MFFKRFLNVPLQRKELVGVEWCRSQVFDRSFSIVWEISSIVICWLTFKYILYSIMSLQKLKMCKIFATFKGEVVSSHWVTCLCCCHHPPVSGKSSSPESKTNTGENEDCNHSQAACHLVWMKIGKVYIEVLLLPDHRRGTTPRQGFRLFKKLFTSKFLRHLLPKESKNATCS